MAVQSNLTCTDSGLFKACGKIPFCFTEAGYHCLLLSFLQNFSIKVWDNCGLSHRVAFEHFPCNGLAVGNFYVGNGDVLPPLEMHFCHSIFTAGHSDPRSSCFPSDPRRPRSNAARLEMTPKERGSLSSCFLISISRTCRLPFECRRWMLPAFRGCDGFSAPQCDLVWVELSFCSQRLLWIRWFEHQKPISTCVTREIRSWFWGQRPTSGLCFSPTLNHELARNKAHWKMQIFCRLWKLTPLINLHI